MVTEEWGQSQNPDEVVSMVAGNQQSVIPKIHSVMLKETTGR